MTLFDFKVAEIKLRSVFIHVDVPGQDDNAPDLENFPTILELGKQYLFLNANLIFNLHFFCAGLLLLYRPRNTT